MWIVDQAWGPGKWWCIGKRFIAFTIYPCWAASPTTVWIIKPWHLQVPPHWKYASWFIVHQVVGILSCDTLALLHNGCVWLMINFQLIKKPTKISSSAFLPSHPDFDRSFSIVQATYQSRFHLISLHRRSTSPWRYWFLPPWLVWSGFQLRYHSRSLLVSNYSIPGRLSFWSDSQTQMSPQSKISRPKSAMIDFVRLIFSSIRAHHV